MSISLREGNIIGVSRRRGGKLLGAGLLGTAAVALFLVLHPGRGGPAVASTAAKSNVLTVSVLPVRHALVPTTVSIIGNIAARYDTPIGVEGDGGRVAALYVEAGQRVHRGQILARLDDAVIRPQVANLEAALELAQAEADLAAAEYQRALKLGGAGALSKEETERRRSSALTATAKVKVAAAQLAEAKARLARTEVRAPADGLLLTRTVEVGQTVGPGGDPLFRMAEGGEVELRGEVAEQDLPLLKVGQTAHVSLAQGATTYEGKVRLLGAVIDSSRRLGQVRIELKPDPNLRPGAFAHAEVMVDEANQVVLPQTAVLSDEKGSYVLVVDAAHKVERRAVRVTGITAGGVAVSGPLAEHEAVVATASAFLEEGELVRPVEPTS